MVVELMVASPAPRYRRQARQAMDQMLPRLRLPLEAASAARRWATQDVDLSLAAMPDGGHRRDHPRRHPCATKLHAARQAEASWRELCDAAPVGIMRCDPRGIVTYANWAAELTALGAQAPLLGHPLRAWLGDDPAFDMAALEAALTMPGAQIGHERETGTAERRLWLSVTVTAKFDPAGRRLGYVVAATDITARKRLERELIDARQRRGRRRRQERLSGQCQP
jgi:PAS domain S-box-containing protein